MKSSRAWLEAEFYRFSARFGPRHRQMLQRLGVPDDIMLHLSGIGVSATETNGEFWQPAESGPLAMVIPAFHGIPPSFVNATEDESEQPHDLIAFDPDRPGRWWWRVGTADTLGCHLISSAHTWGTPVHVVTDPLAWLQHRGQVVCLLKPEAAWKLIGVVKVIADTLETAERIDCLLRRPPAALPVICVAPRAAP